MAQVAFCHNDKVSNNPLSNKEAVSFQASLSANLTSKSGSLAAYVIVFNTVGKDTHSAFATPTYTFPHDGVYLINATLALDGQSAAPDYLILTAGLTTTANLLSGTYPLLNLNAGAIDNATATNLVTLTGSTVAVVKKGDTFNGLTLKTTTAVSILATGTLLSIVKIA